MNTTAGMAHPGGTGAAGEERGGFRSGRRRGCDFGWRPIELVAMVLGFIVFWPIGLAIIAWKIWQRRTGYPGDLATFTQEKVDDMRNRAFGSGPARRWGFTGAGPGYDPPPRRGDTGNRAFDDWKNAELERLEEERRKLDEAQKEFADYLAHLRQARDREEFDRFRRERDAARARGEPGWKPFGETRDGEQPGGEAPRG